MPSQVKSPHSANRSAPNSANRRSIIVRRRSLRAAAMAACAGTSLLCLFDRALATTRTFTAGSGNEWTNAANWTPTGTPVAGDDAVIPSTSTGTMTITGSNITTGDIIYSSTSPQTLANGGADATNVTLTLTGNGTAPLIDLNSGSMSTQPNFIIQGANGSTGTGTLGLILGASGDFTTTNLGLELFIPANISETGGSQSINKNGNGLLNMGGANTFSGAMELTQSSAIWDYSTNTGDKIASTGSLMFNGGSLTLASNASTAVNETVSSLNVVASRGTLTLNPAGNQNLNLSVGAINRTQGGALNIVLNNAAGTPTVTTTASNDPYGIIGGWATVGTSDWATISAGNIVALPSASYTDQANAGNWATGQNITNTTSGAYSGTVNTLTIGSLKVNNASNSVVTIGSAATLTIGSGGILNTLTNANPMSITGGNLTSGGQDLIFNNTGSGVFNVSSAITDNGAASIGLTKTGSGTLVLTGNNTFSGQVIVNGGSLDISSIGALGTGANYATITLGTSGSTVGNVATGTLDFQFNNGVLTRPIDLGSAGGAIRGAGNASTSFGTLTTIASTISGGSLFRFGIGGTTILSGTNTYTGQTVIEAGTLEAMTLASLGTPSSIGTGTTDPTLVVGAGTNAGTFEYAGTTDANTGRNLILSGSPGGGQNVQIINSNTVAVNSITSATNNAGSFGKYGPGTLEVTGSGANFGQRIFIVRGTYQFDDPTGVGTASSNIDIGDGNAAALVYGGTTPVTVTRPLDTISSNVPSSTIQSNLSTMTLTGGFTSNATAKQNIILSGAGGVIFNSNISGTGAGTLTKSGTGTAELMGTDNYINTTISGGTLILASSAALGNNGGTVGILNSSSALAMANNFTPAITLPSPDTTPFTNNGTINVNQGKIVVDYTAADRYAILKAQVAAGYNHGAWNGPDSATSGVINSAAANAASTTPHPTGVAIAEGSVLNTPGYVAYNNGGTYGGQPVDSTSVVLGYTYEGDATMNGSVDSNDFAILAANYNKSSSTLGWTDGDFNYDGTVNALDFNLLADNYGQSQLPADLPDAALPDATLGAVVPEPTTLAGLALLSVMGLRRRRQS